MVRAGLPITRRTEPSSIRSASCRLLRKSAPQQSLWTAWTSLARPTPPTGQQQHQSGHLMCYEGRTSSRALDSFAHKHILSSVSVTNDSDPVLFLDGHPCTTFGMTNPSVF